MTQQLQQSIKLLQLSSLELNAYIEQELEKNPLLTVEEQEESESAQEEGGESAESPEQEEGAGGEPSAVDAKAPETQDWEEGAGEQDAPAYAGGSGDESRMRTHSGGEETEGFESFGASETTLREHLLGQLFATESDSAMRLIGQHLIDLVDEDGYIKEDTSGLTGQLGCEPELIEEAFALLQGFEPSGICARTLRECLSVQLRDKNRLDPAMERLLEHLDWVAGGDIAALSKACGVDGEDIREMCAEIRALNPRPGNGFTHEPVQAVVPDVLLRRTRNGWQVELNQAALPRVLVNRRYYAQLSSRTRDKAEKKYITDQLASANWLVKALDQRAHTILKVSTEIVSQQSDFIREGIQFLRPLTLREVAAVTDLHESTVSRVTSGKFMATPRGTFELKYFFNASLANTSGGDNYSNKSVQHLIREMIEKEPPGDPLSDEAIAIALQARGIEVARRTVAKYRDILRIPSSSQRRKKHRAG